MTRRCPHTFDFVEEATGHAYGHECDGGHDWMMDGPAEMVREVPAAFLKCARCGIRGFHWIPANVRAGVIE